MLPYGRGTHTHTVRVRCRRRRRRRRRRKEEEEEEERVDAEEEEGGDIWSMKAMIVATLPMILRSISRMNVIVVR